MTIAEKLRNHKEMEERNRQRLENWKREQEKKSACFLLRINV